MTFRFLAHLPLLLLCFSVGRGSAGAQQPATAGNAVSGPGTAATVTYQFERPGLSVPRFKIVVHEDGTGSYEGDEVPSSADGAGSASTGATAHIKQEISLTQANTAKIFKAARAQKYFAATCSSRAKNVADTGAKMLSYEGADGKGSCSFNFSENKDVIMLAELFFGISQTLEEGRKLEFKHRYDHLGLDAELDSLTKESDAAQAVELGTIAPILRKLASDTELMERVRLRAAKLLDRAAAGR